MPVGLAPWERRGMAEQRRPRHRHRTRGSFALDCLRSGRSGRGGRIRTGDLLLPKQARYQAAPRPDVRAGSDPAAQGPSSQWYLPCSLARRGARPRLTTMPMRPLRAALPRARHRLLLLPLLLTGCLPDAATRQGGHVAGLYTLFMLAAAVVFAVVVGLMGWSIWRYRGGGPRDSELPDQTHGNLRLETAWWALP